jgi:hypothetical protein
MAAAGGSPRVEERDAMRTGLWGLGVVLAVALVGGPPASPGQPPAPPAAWHAIEGSWNAAGHRRILPAEDGRTAGTVFLTGAVVLVSGGATSRGFQGEAIAYDDGTGEGVGRAVWTDERGDRIFSRLSLVALAAGRRVSATITGGTGRYAGVEGEYAFEWQYVVEGEAGAIQGHAVGLKGRLRSKGAGR